MDIPWDKTISLLVGDNDFMLFEEANDVFDKSGGRLFALHVITLDVSEPKEMG